jgi:hypothetical protein
LSFGLDEFVNSFQDPGQRQLGCPS